MGTLFLHPGQSKNELDEVEDVMFQMGNGIENS
jgi:hypothetical protein